MIIEQSIERVRLFIRDQRWSNAQYAREAGIHPNTLRDIDKASWSPNSDTLRKLEAVIPEDFGSDAMGRAK